MRRLFDLLLLLLMGISFSNQSSAMMNIVDTGQKYDVNYIASDVGIYGYDTAPGSQNCCLTSLTKKAQERLFLAFASDFLATKRGGQTFERVVSNAELKATQNTGLLRGGREGENFFTNSASLNGNSGDTILISNTVPIIKYRVPRTPSVL